VNTSTVYVEPIFVGCLIGLALALPFYSELTCFYDKLPPDLQSPTFLGVIVIGAAYVIGIPADRLLDSLMDGLAGHRRIRFLLKDALKHESMRQRIIAGENPFIAGQDPFPEDRYRTAALLYASREFNDWLQYIRTRVRMTRALTFTIPSLTFAVLAYAVPKDNSSTIPEWLLKSGVPMAWTFAILFALLLQWHASKHCRKRDKVSTCVRFWRPRGRWNPPHTKETCDISNYMQDRIRKCAKNSCPASSIEVSVGGLFLDVALQPFPVSGALLLVAAVIVGYCSGLEVVGLITAATGALLTCAVGYAWWRLTETFMSYVLLAGRELER
jgi:hypothetical protein